MTLHAQHQQALSDAFSDLKTGTGERGQFRAFLGDGRGVGTIINPIPPTYREVWIHTGSQSTTSTGNQVLSVPLSWLASLLIPYVNDPQYENMPVVVGYAPGSSNIEVLRPDGLGAAQMLRNPGLYARQNWFAQPYYTNQCRLTSTNTGFFIDSTTFTTLYLYPVDGNLVGTYNGHTWRVKPVTSAASPLSLSLSGFAANTNFDIFLADNNGSPILQSLAWASNTARATALVNQDDVAVLTGNTTWRYLGTIRTTGTIGQSADSPTQRFISNEYNKVLRPIRVFDGTASWAYVTASWRQVNANAANKIEVVTGRGAGQDSFIHLDIHEIWSTSSNGITVFTGVGIDSTTVQAANQIGGASNINNNYNIAHAMLDDYVALGYHVYNWIELGAANVTFFGAQTSSGMSGFLVC